MSRPKLFRIIDKAVFDYKLIENGDNILVGASGGKDSSALIQYFSDRKRQKREEFNFTALYISSGISPPFSDELLETFKNWNVDFKSISIDVLARLKPARTMNCWWCSTQRRTELNNFAIKYGYNKIALGHHLDDILETVLMNALQKKELSTMPPRLSYAKYPVTVIRPLCYADEKTIIKHAHDEGFVKSTCTCSYQANSGRKEARSRLAALTDGNVQQKRNLFLALKNIKTNYLP